MNLSMFGSLLLEVVDKTQDEDMQRLFIRFCRDSGLGNMGDGLERLFKHQPKLNNICCGRTIADRISDDKFEIQERYIARAGDMLFTDHFSGLPVMPSESELEYAVAELNKQMISVPWAMLSIRPMAVGIWDEEHCFTGGKSSRAQEGLRLINETLAYLYVQRNLIPR